MIATLQLDSMGSLHAWKGEHNPYRKSGYLYTVNGKEAELFIADWEVDYALEHLTEEEREHLKRGYSLITKNLPSDYFMFYGT